ncbi:MAG: hypothetical protein RLZ98_1112 [Pseudomonadota bacterium]|jgi:alkanesulfonate monooxygenase SsuD/methylene tetrahydromethanopterin reductase-like flavin-dependent oxidoreductase (luciferase family)
MEFGVFDHVDATGRDLCSYYDERLRLTELYDALGYSRYHVAEHHATPLGLAPSPSVYLAAVSQRTRRLRFGPMVYAVPLYHPLRLAEEICMLDQMSGGRLELGFGRGASPIEASFFGWQRADMPEVYQEGTRIILEALEKGHLTHKGRHFSFDGAPLCLEPVQRPHPPLWYGVHAAESAGKAAARKLNMISLDSAEETRAYVDAYREVWHRENPADVPQPLIGISYFIVIAEESAEALEVARRSYPVWHASFNSLFQRHGTAPRHQRPGDFDGIMREGRAIAGSPRQVKEFLAEACAVSGINYVVGQFAFGDQTYEETARSVRLFAEFVMPGLK